MIESFLVILGAILVVGVAAALRFWTQFLEWTRRTIIPWLEEKSPKLASLARQALVAVDKVAVPLRRKIRKAWTKLREWLLQELMELRRQSSGTWIKTSTTWLVTILESGEAAPVKRVVEEEVDWDDLPSDVRDASLKWDKNKKTINVTELKDKEILEMAYDS